jgi:hypothetical protein
MAIFNSYVKLPEGIISVYILGFSNQPCLIASSGFDGTLTRSVVDIIAIYTEFMQSHKK